MTAPELELNVVYGLLCALGAVHCVRHIVLLLILLSRVARRELEYLSNAVHREAGAWRRLSIRHRELTTDNRERHNARP